MIDHDHRVHIFKNWKHNCYSIMQHGVVVASARQVRLGDVEFRVRETGRERMLQRQKKNLHAYAIGRLLDFVHPTQDRDLGRVEGRSVFYNPYRFAYFADCETETPVAGADIVQLDEHGVTYQDLDPTNVLKAATS
ncbi:MAG: hypothetical protein DRJ65_02860 [Acidobacteria bacterium]|nr:MAG: hypothetical protein DRJ65_02860 [Acidobacteriota bacterium]